MKIVPFARGARRARPQRCSRSATGGTARPSRCFPARSTTRPRCARCGRRTARRASSRRTATCSRRGWTRAGARMRGSSSPGMPCASRSSCATCTRRPPPRWVEEGRTRHYVYVPAHDAELVDAWFRLGFGAQHAFGIRELTDEPIAVPRRRGRDRAGATRATSRRWSRSGLALPGISRSHRSSPSLAPDDPDEESARRSSRTSTKPEIGNLVAELDGRVVGNFVVVPIEMSGAHTRPGASRRIRASRLRGGSSGGSRFGRRPRADRGELRVGARAGLPGDGDRLARDQPPVLAVLAETRVPHDVPPAVPIHSVKIPVLSGSGVAVVNVPDDAVVLRPPPPVETVPEIGAAVRDAVRFPLAGEPLEALVRPGGTATIVLDHPSLPMPSAQADPRQDALFAVVDELERLGVPSQRQTLLVAGGLERRTGQAGARAARHARAGAEISRPRRGARRRGPRSRRDRDDRRAPAAGQPAAAGE